MRTPPAEDPWAPVRGARAVMLTTYRRDGRAVPTPVGYGIDGPELYLMTDPASGKVKRLRHTPRVSVSASTLRGHVTGPELSGEAQEITGAEAENARRVITSKNRLAWFFLLRKARREGRSWMVYAVRPSTEQGPHITDDTDQHAVAEEYS